MVWFTIIVGLIGVILAFGVSMALEKSHQYSNFSPIALVVGIILMLISAISFCVNIMNESIESDKVCMEKSKYDDGDVVLIKGLEKKFIVKDVSCNPKGVSYTLVSEGLPEMKIEEGKLE